MSHETHSGTTLSLPLLVHQVPSLVLLDHAVLPHVGLSEVYGDAGTDNGGGHHQGSYQDSCFRLGLGKGLDQYQSQ